ncbi:MAG: response regulator, partial [Actinobacteria bacterium]|nr:response regulator [Actinomycetota bacterium]
MLRIIIAEDDPYMRLILRRVIEEISGLEVVAEAEDGIKLIQLVEELAPDVVFLDIAMSNMSGLEAAKKIFSINPTIAIIFATGYDNYMREAFEAYA